MPVAELLSEKTSEFRSMRIKVAIAVAIVVGIVAVLVSLTLFGFKTMNGLRAFVEGEGLWSKYERDAIADLRRYVLTGDDAAYRSFEREIEVLEGVERSRLELGKPDPDIDLIHRGFLDLGLDARDMDDLVNVYRRFHGFEHVEIAIAAWAHADERVADLRVIGEAIRRDRPGALTSADEVESHLAEVAAVSADLNEAEIAFSSSLGSAAHWALGVLTAVTVSFALLALLIMAALLYEGNRLIVGARVDAEQLVSQAWLRSSLSSLGRELEGDNTVVDLARAAITTLARDLEAPVGAFYLRQGDVLRVIAAHSVAEDEVARRFALGEGLVGRAAASGEPVVLDEVPDGYLTLRSGLGATSPRQVLIQPTMFEGRISGVIELASMDSFSPAQRELLALAADRVAVAMGSARAREKQQELLEETQTQAEELQAQQEELRQANDELSARTRSLEASEHRLQAQQAELESVNAELEERSEAVQREARLVKKKNAELALARDQIERKARELEEMSRYKSEFLANMSHELRTPLNSILLLSKLLAEDKEENLSKRQVEFARTVHDSGNELIALIDEILDQARIESGQLRLVFEPLDFGELLGGLERQFRPAAEERGLSFEVIASPDLPDSVHSDGQRVRQILKNLLSNALKFTQNGRITMRVQPADPRVVPAELAEKVSESFLELAVEDTGIGIAPEMQDQVFEAFRQAEGATDRKYGGTGLGLAISAKLAELLGGTLVLESEPARGSCFTLLLPTEAPVSMDAEEQTVVLFPELSSADSSDDDDAEEASEDTAESPPATAEQPPVPAPAPRPDDRAKMTGDDRAVLIIEDDVVFSSLLADLARERGFMALVAGGGQEGLDLARRFDPSAILLDIGLPDIDGVAVLERLKDDLDLRHIPVHVLSAHERNLEALKAGAVGYLRKPVGQADIAGVYRRIEDRLARPVRRLLLVVDDQGEQGALTTTLGGDDVEVTAVETGEQALAQARTGHFDCVVVQWDLPDIDGKEILLTIRRTPEISSVPVIILGGENLTRDETLAIDRYADRHVIRDERARARLLDDTALFLHRVESNLPEEQRQIIQMLHDREALFRDSKLLLVDDDMRNVFALHSLLEDAGLEVLVARNGAEALEKLDETPDMDVVLMDIMMPEMDGYEAMRRLRADGRFDDLPVIALTAKAMRDDRAKCIEAGASDYLTKPVDDEKLLSMLRVWLYR